MLYFIYMFKLKSHISIRFVAMCLACLVFLNSIPGIEEARATNGSPEQSRGTLAPSPGVLNPAVRGEGWIMALEKSRRLVYSDNPEQKELYRRIMEQRDWPDALLLENDGKILVSEKIKQDRIKVIRAVIHEEIEALMQMMAHSIDPDEAKRKREKDRHEKIRQEVFSKRAILKSYLELFPEDKRKLHTEPDLHSELVLNDIIARGFELEFLVRKNLVSRRRDFTLNEWRFYKAINPIIAGHSEFYLARKGRQYFGQEFHNPELRKDIIETAYANGFVFDRAESVDGRQSSVDSREKDTATDLHNPEAVPEPGAMRAGGTDIPTPKVENVLPVIVEVHSVSFLSDADHVENRLKKAGIVKNGKILRKYLLMDSPEINEFKNKQLPEGVTVFPSPIGEISAVQVDEILGPEDESHIVMLGGSVIVCWDLAIDCIIRRIAQRIKSGEKLQKHFYLPAGRFTYPEEHDPYDFRKTILKTLENNGLTYKLFKDGHLNEDTSRQETPDITLHYVSRMPDLINAVEAAASNPRSPEAVPEPGLDERPADRPGKTSYKEIDNGVYREIKFTIIPEEAGSHEEQLKNCLSTLRKNLAKLGAEKGAIIKQTVFIKAAKGHDYFAKKENLTACIDRFYENNSMPASFVAQPSVDGSNVSMEVTVLLPLKGRDLKIEHKVFRSVRYAVIKIGGSKFLHVTGITAGEEIQGRHAQSEEVFSIMKAILDREGLSFDDVVRQWNYVEDIVEIPVEGDGKTNNYTIFCGIRAKYYAASAFKNGYASATGIGIDAGGVTIEFIAAKTDETAISIVPVENPEQIAPYNYSQRVLVGDEKGSKPSPKFERAKAVVRKASKKVKLYISGTASVKGEDVLYPDDNYVPTWVKIKNIALVAGGPDALRARGFQVEMKNFGEPGRQAAIYAKTAIEAQTWVTIDNIAVLMSQPNLAQHRITAKPAFKDVHQIRVYVKRTHDPERVKDICRKIFTDSVSLYVISDICRTKWLVEIEGEADFDGEMKPAERNLLGATEKDVKEELGSLERRFRMKPSVAYNDAPIVKKALELYERLTKEHLDIEKLGINFIVSGHQKWPAFWLYAGVETGRKMRLDAPVNIYAKLLNGATHRHILHELLAIRQSTPHWFNLILANIPFIPFGVRKLLFATLSKKYQGRAQVDFAANTVSRGDEGKENLSASGLRGSEADEIMLDVDLTEEEMQIIDNVSSLYSTHGVNEPTCEYLPISMAGIEAFWRLCKKLNVPSCAKFYDMGFGDGRLMAAMAALGLDTYGNELNAQLARKAKLIFYREIAGSRGLENLGSQNVHFKQGDYFGRDLSEFDIIFHWPGSLLSQESMEDFKQRLKEKLLSPTGLKPGAKYVVFFSSENWLDVEDEFDITKIENLFEIYQRKPETTIQVLDIGKMLSAVKSEEVRRLDEPEALLTPACEKEAGDSRQEATLLSFGHPIEPFSTEGTEGKDIGFLDSHTGRKPVPKVVSEDGAVKATPSAAVTALQSSSGKPDFGKYKKAIRKTVILAFLTSLVTGCVFGRGFKMLYRADSLFAIIAGVIVVGVIVLSYIIDFAHMIVKIAKHLKRKYLRSEQETYSEYEIFGGSTFSRAVVNHSRKPFTRSIAVSEKLNEEVPPKISEWSLPETATSAREEEIGDSSLTSGRHEVPLGMVPGLWWKLISWLQAKNVSKFSIGIFVFLASMIEEYIFSGIIIEEAPLFNHVIANSCVSFFLFFAVHFWYVLKVNNGIIEKKSANYKDKRDILRIVLLIRTAYLAFIFFIPSYALPLIMLIHGLYNLEKFIRGGVLAMATLPVDDEEPVRKAYLEEASNVLEEIALNKKIRRAMNEIPYPYEKSLALLEFAKAAKTRKDLKLARGAIDKIQRPHYKSLALIELAKATKTRKDLKLARGAIDEIEDSYEKSLALIELAKATGLNFSHTDINALDLAGYVETIGDNARLISENIKHLEFISRELEPKKLSSLIRLCEEKRFDLLRIIFSLRAGKKATPEKRESLIRELEDELKNTENKERIKLIGLLKKKVIFASSIPNTILVPAIMIPGRDSDMKSVQEAVKKGIIIPVGKVKDVRGNTVFKRNAILGRSLKDATGLKAINNLFLIPMVSGVNSETHGRSRHTDSEPSFVFKGSGNFYAFSTIPGLHIFYDVNEIGRFDGGVIKSEIDPALTSSLHRAFRKLMRTRPDIKALTEILNVKEDIFFSPETGFRPLAIPAAITDRRRAMASKNTRNALLADMGETILLEREKALEMLGMDQDMYVMFYKTAVSTRTSELSMDKPETLRLFFGYYGLTIRKDGQKIVVEDASGRSLDKDKAVEFILKAAAFRLRLASYLAHNMNTLLKSGKRSKMHNIDGSVLSPYNTNLLSVFDYDTIESSKDESDFASDISNARDLLQILSDQLAFNQKDIITGFYDKVGKLLEGELDESDGFSEECSALRGSLISDSSLSIEELLRLDSASEENILMGGIDRGAAGSAVRAEDITNGQKPTSTDLRGPEAASQIGVENRAVPICLKTEHLELSVYARRQPANDAFKVCGVQLSENNFHNNTNRIAEILKVMNTWGTWKPDIVIFPETMDDPNSINVDPENRISTLQKLVETTGIAAGYFIETTRKDQQEKAGSYNCTYTILRPKQEPLVFHKFERNMQNRFFVINGTKAALFICSECKNVIKRSLDTALYSLLEEVDVILLPAGTDMAEAVAWPKKLAIRCKKPVVFVNFGGPKGLHRPPSSFIFSEEDVPSSRVDVKDEEGILFADVHGYEQKPISKPGFGIGSVAISQPIEGMIEEARRAIEAFKANENNDQIGVSQELLVDAIRPLTERIESASPEELTSIGSFFKKLRDRDDIPRKEALAEVALALVKRKETGDIGGEADLECIRKLDRMKKRELLTRFQKEAISELPGRDSVGGIFDDMKELVFLEGATVQRTTASHRTIFTDVPEGSAGQLSEHIMKDFPGSKMLRRKSGRMAISRYICDMAMTMPYFAVIIDEHGFPMRTVIKDKEISGDFDNISHITGNRLIDAIRGVHVWVEEGKRYVYIREIRGVDMVDFLSELGTHSANEEFMEKFFFSLGAAMAEAHVLGMCDRWHNLVINIKKIKRYSEEELLDIKKRAIVNIDRENLLTRRYLEKSPEEDFYEASRTMYSLTGWVLPHDRQTFIDNMENYLRGFRRGYETIRSRYVADREEMTQQLEAVLSEAGQDTHKTRILERLSITDERLDVLVENLRSKIRKDLRVDGEETEKYSLPTKMSSGTRRPGEKAVGEMRLGEIQKAVDKLYARLQRSQGIPHSIDFARLRILLGKQEVLAAKTDLDEEKEFIIFNEILRRENLEEYNKRAKEADEILGEDDVKGQSIAIYADDLLEEVAVVDFEKTVKDVLIKHDLLAGGTVFLYARKEKNGKIMRNMIERASRKIKVTTKTLDELIREKPRLIKAHPKSQSDYAKEARALLEVMKAEGAGDVLALIKGPGGHPQNLASLKVPVVLVGLYKHSTYSFAEALNVAVHMRQSGLVFRVYILRPVGPLTPELEKEYLGILRTLQSA
ncbi:MAG: hypothetical protein ISS92_00665 [Candidatus Omnitrophica bacterium]|nr:hypothetical protein [Candidatus Omnitrophota bacterium]